MWTMCFILMQALHSRLSALKVTVSNSTFLKKLDEYGNKFDELVLEEKDRVSACMKKKAELKLKKEEVLALAKEYTCEIPESVVSAPSSPTVQDQQAMAMNSQIKEVEDEIKALDHMSISGMQFVIDNFDLRQDVRDMTCENQNKDYHWTNHNCVLNRVTGAHLDNDKPVCDLNDLSNGSVLPQARDHLNNRENYIVLVQRVLVDCIPALGFLKGAVQKHIPHKYSKEMAERTKKVFLYFVQMYSSWGRRGGGVELYLIHLGVGVCCQG